MNQPEADHASSELSVEQLERITARQLSDGVLLDGQAELLREGWLSWARLLEKTEPDGALPEWVAPMPRRAAGRHGQWLQVATRALAASLLAALAIGWYMLLSHRTELAELPWPGGSAIVADAPSGDLEELDLRWNDPLDDQLVQAGWQIQYARSDWRYPDVPTETIRLELEQISEGLQDDSL